MVRITKIRKFDNIFTYQRELSLTDNLLFLIDYFYHYILTFKFLQTIFSVQIFLSFSANNETLLKSSKAKKLTMTDY